MHHNISFRFADELSVDDTVLIESCNKLNSVKVINVSTLAMQGKKGRK